MSAKKTLPDLLHRTREVRGEEVFYGFSNGLTIKTEIFNKSDRLRILPLGTPQGSLMNHVLGFPDSVRDKRVFEPFAGSGALGFMALKAGAAHVDFLDVNPRAAEFHRENAGLSQISSSRFTSITGDIANFAPERKCDLILANPPFVPTPEGIEGTITSNGGPEGSRFVGILLDRLERLLEPGGRALIYVFQLTKDARPLIVERLGATLERRPVELTAAQKQPIPFETYCRAYLQLFPKASSAIDHWRSDLLGRHGGDLALCHYVVDVGPQSGGPADCILRENFAEKFGEAFFVPSGNPAELAFGRVFENFTPVAPED
ncbi:MAG: methyltransferase [Myxococcota bacterium]